jgi:hypothetical protein
MSSPAAKRLRIEPRAAALTIAADRALEGLFRVRSKGAKPRVSEHDGEIDVDYTIAGRLRALSARSGSLDVALNPAATWAIELRGGVSGLRADLRELSVSEVAITGSAHDIAVDLPKPRGELELRIAGSVAEAIVRRPAGVPAAVEIEGAAADLRLDDEEVGAVAGAVRRRTVGESSGEGEVAVRVAGAASKLTVAVVDE